MINYSLPQNAESYVHRIGRTGRAGGEGKAITLITPSEYRKLRDFERHAKADIQKDTIPGSEKVVEMKKQKIKKDMEALLENSTASQKYMDMAVEMFGEHDPATIVAALMEYSFADRLDEKAYPNIGQGGSRRDRDRGRERDNGRRASTKDSFGNARLFLTTGRVDGATPPKILHMIDTEFGVPGSAVGEIDIMESFSFISVPLKEAEMILDAFHAAKKKGIRPSVRIERAEMGKRIEKKGRPKGRRSGGSRSNFGRKK